MLYPTVRPRYTPAVSTPSTRTAVTLGVYLVLSVLFSWPLVTDPAGMHLSPQFDVYGLAWVLDGASAIDRHLVMPLARWPEGESLLRADSFVILGLGLAFARWMGAWALISAVSLVGPVLSGWAAERCAARALGARFPWSLIAGFAYGYSGLAATALLEGHVYGMFNPWLPLMAWKALEATRPGARPGVGAQVAVWWALALATTAYAGVAATLLLGLIVLAAVVRRRLERSPVLGFCAVAVPVAVAYVALYASGGPPAGQAALEHLPDTRMVTSVGSAHLGTLIGYTPTVDFLGHSIAPSLGLTAIALAAFAPRVLRPSFEWRVMGIAGVIALMLSLGPYLEFFTMDVRIPWILWPIGAIPAAGAFHFPARLMAVATLGIGCVAALVAGRLAERSPVAARALLLFAALDPLVQSAVAFRAPRVPTAAPSAYLSAPADRAVLDFLPSFSADHGDLGELLFFTNRVACSYQVSHRRPILGGCLATGPDLSPRLRVSSWLSAGLLRGDDPAAITGPLADIGVGAVAYHPDLFVVEDRVRLDAALRDVFGVPLAATADGGERIVLFGVEPAPTTAASRLEAYHHGAF